MDLPLHVQTAIGADSSIEEGELALHAGACQFAQEVFGLSGADFASAAVLATSGANSFSVVRSNRGPISWKYIEIAVDTTLECAGACTPEVCDKSPPTAASQVLVGGWFSHGDLLDGRNIAPQKIVRRIKSGLPASSFPARFFDEWANACAMLDGCASLPIWIGKNQLHYSTTSRILSTHAPGARFQDLFVEAVSEVKAKWRYLSLYRILEHGYLSEVFEALKSDFFLSPKESVVAAAQSLESELGQFFSLVQGAGLDSRFESFIDEFESVKSSGNRFATALDRSLNHSGQIKLTRGKGQKGVLVCYKIRCAIVHAGMSAPIFDAFSDGSDCLERLLPILEPAVLGFLGVQAH